jgi:hypothetical protein
MSITEVIPSRAYLFLWGKFGALANKKRLQET